MTLSDTQFLFESIPEYLQEWDAANGNQLLDWLDGACAMLQPTDDLARDNPDGGTLGWSLLFNYYYYYSGTLNGVTCTGLQDIADVNQALVILPWFAQFVGARLPQIPYDILSPGDSTTTEEFIASIQPFVNNWVLQIVKFNSFERGTLEAVRHQFALFLSNLNGFGRNAVSITSAYADGDYNVYYYSGSLPFGVGDYCCIYGFKGDEDYFNATDASVVYADTGIFVTMASVAPSHYDGSLSSSSMATAVQSLPPEAFTVLEQTKTSNKPGISFEYNPYYVTFILPKKLVPNADYYSVFLESPATYAFYASEYLYYSDYPNPIAAIAAFLNIVLPGGLIGDVITV